MTATPSFVGVRRRFGLFLLPLLALLALPLLASADDAPTTQPAKTEAAPSTQPAASDSPEVVALKQKVLAAYDALQTYQASKRVHYLIEHEGQKQDMTFNFKVAYDRKAGKLAVDGDQIRLVAGDGMIRLHSRPAMPRYLKQTAAQPLSGEALSNAWPPFPMLAGTPDLSILTKADMVTLLGENGFSAPGPEAGDAAGRPRLSIKQEQGMVTLWVEPQSHLVSKAQLVMGDGPFTATITYDVTISPLDAALPEDVFAFDPGAAEAVDTLAAMIGAPQQEAEPAQELVGKPAPAIKLPKLAGGEFDLATTDAKVIVLDFWATWCGPCRRGLPHLQKLAEWGASEKKSLAVYAVNIQEDAQQINQFLEKEKLTLNVLLDQQGAVAELYKVQGIPQTVVIAGGKVRKVYVGLMPNMEELLRADIEAALTN